MTETELTQMIKRLTRDPRRRTTMSQYIFQPTTPEQVKVLQPALERDAQIRRGERSGLTAFPDPTLPPPTTAEAVRAAEEAVGFRFPPLLGRLWTEVGNGGFGPGYGLLGIEGGFADELQGLTTAQLYLSAVKDDAWAKFLGEPWPQKLVPICDWGCQHQSAIDCTTPEGEVVDLLEGYQPKRKAITFSQWMEAWVNGLELWPW
jgi:hypothetical protein